MRSIINIIFLCLLVISCKGRSERLIERDWIFAETPPVNLNSHQGYTQNRSVFNGSETISFKEDGTFLVNDVNYGTWEYDHEKKSISIYSMNGGYSYTGFGQSQMYFEIIKSTRNKLQVYHRYYKYPNNSYDLKQKK